MSRTLFVTNFSLPGLTPEPTPGIVSFGVQLPGLAPGQLGRCRGEKKGRLPRPFFRAQRHSDIALG